MRPWKRPRLLQQEARGGKPWRGSSPSTPLEADSGPSRDAERRAGRLMGGRFTFQEAGYSLLLTYHIIKSHGAGVREQRWWGGEGERARALLASNSNSEAVQ